MKTRLILSILFLLVMPTVVLASVTPRSEKEIPIYPGSVRDQAAEKEALRQDTEYSKDIIKTWRSNTVKVYTVKAIINEVAGFYIQKLAAKEGAPDNFVPKPGAVLPPWYELSCYEPDIFKDQYDDKDKLFYDGKWVKSVFSQRKQWSKNEWLSNIRFEWNIVLSNGDMAQYSVLVEDEGYDAWKKVIFNTTRITVRILVTKSREALTDEQDQEMDRETEEKTSQFAKNTPSQKTLGVPIYPGSVFDPENSAGMSLDGEYQYYIYLSNDPPSKVLAFYEQRLGKKAISNEGGYIIALKGQLPIPEEGLTIQPNTMFGGKAKTVITVQKQN
ncbi:MAG TPA: hypothetical protein VHY08_06705 [Bacillota bacterium]|nr:hypothetical protein [Bacillota bacterium]